MLRANSYTSNGCSRLFLKEQRVASRPPFFVYAVAPSKSVEVLLSKPTRAV